VKNHLKRKRVERSVENKHGESCLLRKFRALEQCEKEIVVKVGQVFHSADEVKLAIKDLCELTGKLPHIEDRIEVRFTYINARTIGGARNYFKFKAEQKDSKTWVAREFQIPDENFSESNQKSAYNSSLLSRIVAPQLHHTLA